MMAKPAPFLVRLAWMGSIWLASVSALALVTMIIQFWLASDGR